MKLIAVIQARMGSSRLPGKVLADIAGRSMLEHVFDRVRCVSGLHEVVVATTMAPGDQAIVKECGHIGAPVFRGSENDVLDRYVRASRRYNADAVVRVTADCPLLDPSESDRVVQAFLASSIDLAANDLKPTYPVGLGTEVIRASALEAAWREAKEAYERQHVTPFILHRPERFRLVNVASPSDYSHLRWTVDTHEDLDFVRALFARLEGSEIFGWREVLGVLAREPALLGLNRDVRQKAMEEC
jgi:spore coat polysaccharide biosynthesis protein SpsF